MNKYYYYILSIAAIAAVLFISAPFAGCKAEDGGAHVAIAGENEEVSNPSKFEYYKNLFEKECVEDRITDNFGNGFEDLYGTRNMRPVLHGAAYRGGANNYYHKSNKRNNKNPLPNDGLKNLCREGFSSSVYLYKTNFSKCKTHYVAPENGNEMAYYQNSLGNSEEVREMISLVYKAITVDSIGPVYLHCWNGWHQSGYASAILLRQFCGYTGGEAIAYWNSCAEGGNKGYDHIKNAIRNFKPLDEFAISEKIKEEICPCSKNKD